MNIVVVGTSCAGKTTISRRIADALHLRHVEMDRLYWLPHWQRRSTEDFKAAVTDAVKEDGWITDGNYGVVRNIVWKKADVVVWLDLPMRLSLKRAFLRVMSGEDQASGCKDTVWRSFFTKDSIFLWIVQSHFRRKRQYRELMSDGTYGVKWIHVKKGFGVEKLINELKMLGFQ